MTRPQFEKALREWQRRLGLDAWDIAVEWDEKANEDSDATTWRSADYDRATIRLDSGWAKWTDAFTHRIIVHELVHLLTRDIDEAFKLLKRHVSEAVWAVSDDVYEHEIEGLCDRLSYRLVELAA